MKNNLFIILFATICTTVSAQQINKLYTYGGYVHSTSSPDGVGIDETSPEAALHINQSNNKSTALKIDLEFAHPIPNGQSGTPEYALTVNSYDSSLPNLLSRKFSISSGGRTRIGYGGSGNELLMVSNGIGIYKSTSSNKIRLGYDGGYSQPQLVWKSSTNKNFQFKNTSTGAIPISLSPDGKVGINTDDFFDNHDLYVDGSVYIKDDGEADHSLYIEGSSIAEEMFVKIKDDWGDYVFKDNYPLRPLNDLESFISENGHLPEMPTAEDVKEDGVKTGETIRLLTVKIEELTLYILQQQKEIDALKEKLVKVKSE